MFSRHADRHAHEIWLRDGINWVRALMSVEGSPNEAWPASPPFQSLTADERASKPSALLVGMAGKSHWSASVEVDRSERSIRFDIACRVREGDAGPLGSTYRRDALSFPCDALAIELDHQFGLTELERTSDLFRIAVPTSVTSKARTIRWAYVFRRAGR